MRWAGLFYFNFFWLLPIIIIFYIFAFRRKKNALLTFAEKSILKKLIPTVSFWKQYLKAGLIILVVICIIISLARPQYGFKEELITQKGVDIIIAVDTSNSMNAEDIKPSRLEKVKLALKDLLKKLQGDRVGLVVFSGESFLHCPLTVDYSAVEMLLDTLNTTVVPKPGTNIEKAIKVAMECFNSRDRQYKVLIIMTDGENLQGNPKGAAKEAIKEGVVIYTIGIGSLEGAPIPIKDSSGKVIDIKKDIQGKDIISKLDENGLKEISHYGKGKYFRVTGSGKELEEICSEILNMEKKDFQSNLYSKYEDRFQYILFIAFLLLCCEFLIDERAKKVKEGGGRFE